MRPASQVTRLCLHTSGADEFTREEGSATYIHTRLNESSAAFTTPTSADSMISAGLSIDA